MSNCILKIENPTHIGVIPLNHDIKKIYKLFSGVDCDIVVAAIPGTFSEIGARGCVISRGCPNPDRKFKPKYADRLVMPDHISVCIKIRNSRAIRLVELIRNIMANVEPNSTFEVKTSEDTDTEELNDFQKKNGPYFNVEINLLLSDLNHHLDELSEISWYLS